jgi:hypothetical protein
MFFDFIYLAIGTDPVQLPGSSFLILLLLLASYLQYLFQASKAV